MAEEGPDFTPGYAGESWEEFSPTSPRPPTNAFSDLTVKPTVTRPPPARGRTYFKQKKSRVVVAVFVNQQPRNELHSMVLKKSEEFMLSAIKPNSSVISEHRVVPNTPEGTDSSLMRTFRDLLHSQLPAYCGVINPNAMKQQELEAYQCADANMPPTRFKNRHYTQIDKIPNIALFTHDTYLAAAAAEYAARHATSKSVTIVFDNSKADGLFSNSKDANANGKRAFQAQTANVKVLQYVNKDPVYRVIPHIKDFSDIAPENPLVLLVDTDGGGFWERAEAFVAQTPTAKKLIGPKTPPPSAWAPPPRASGGGAKPSQPPPRKSGKKKKK